MFFFNGTRFVVPIALVTGILPAPAGGNAATENPGKLSYASRMGMTVTIVAKEGIGTANAVIRIKHTPEDAKVFASNTCGIIRCVASET
ncbi:hypothetical protein [Ensifer aridi]|uniref:hypothetical protein n=1 Tax=Ensifer aridi TaxID=1708715 RepID=UPI00111BDB04|nr:hypothetical protein [Ensifer aridi]